jgi:hypothetical protein
MKQKDWKKMAEQGHVTVGNSLNHAREFNLPFYRNECRLHGVTCFRVLDNSCPHCVAYRHAIRRSTNREFNRLRELLHERKTRASAKGHVFEITVDHIRAITPTHCPVLGIELTYGGPLDSSPSIDRLDNTRGYTVDNVRVISTRANRIKSDGTAEEHRLVYEWMLTQQ